MSLLEKEWFIEAPWGRICIIAWGDCCDPPVLVCHGENDSAASFRPLLQLLPRNYYYIGMELPGNGKSDPLPGGLMISLFDLVYSVEAVRKHFRWEQFIFMAHSIACTIGRLYNLSYPSRLSKVIELDQITPSFGTKPDKFAEWYDRHFTQYYDKYDQYNSTRENAPRYTWDELLDKVWKKRGLNAEKARATLERCTEPAEYGLVRLTIDQRIKRLVRPPFSPDQLRTLFTGIRTPTLAIVTTWSINRGLFTNTPFLLEDKVPETYRVRKVEGNHDVHIIHPERLAAHVGQFLLYGSDGLDGKAKL